MKTPTTPGSVVIATTEDIQAGSVMIKSGARLPESAPFESKPYGHWKLLAGVDGFAVERTLSEAGGIFSSWCRKPGLRPFLLRHKAR